MDKRFVYMQVFNRDIFRPQFYRTMEEARAAMFTDIREQLLRYSGAYEALIKRIGGFHDIPNDWWEDGNFIESEPEDVVQYEIGGDYFWMNLPKDSHYDARIINLDSEEE